MNKDKFKEIIEGNSLLEDNIDMPNIMASESFDNEEELREYLEERINEQKIIYYTNAIKFLAENDPSLTESLELARDYGFSVEKLDSEKLATILLQQKLHEELSSCDFSECF